MTESISIHKVVGVDIAKQKFDIYIHGIKINDKQYSNDKIGISTFVTKMSEIGIELVVMEATGSYHRQLAYALQEKHLRVMVCNPRNMRYFAKGIGVLAKTDKVDAKVLCDYGVYIIQKPDFNKYIRPLRSEEQCILDELNTRRNQLLSMRVAEGNRMTKASDISLNSIKIMIGYINEEIESIDKKISEYVNNHFANTNKILQSVKGIGPTVSPTLIASLPELGTLNRRQIGTLVGIVPVARESGKCTGKRSICGGRHEVRKREFGIRIHVCLCAIVC